MHGKTELGGDGDENAAARRAIELGHDEARHAGALAEDIDLIDGVLAGRGIEHEHDIVRGRGVDLLQDADDLLELGHEPFLVLQAAGGIEQKDIVGAVLRGLERVEGEA